MSHQRTHQIESINFNYPLREFAADWVGYQLYAERRSRPKQQIVRLASEGVSESRSLPTEGNEVADKISQWFLDRYGDDPDELYARFMRFTMVADVFEQYEGEIREAGLPLKNGYCKQLAPHLLELKVRPGKHEFAAFDPREVRRAIRKAAASRASDGSRRDKRIS